MLEHNINEIQTRLQNKIEASCGSLLAKFPVENYLVLLDCYPEVVDYQYISHEVKRYTDEILESSNLQTLELYHQLVLVALISRNMEGIGEQKIPDTIKQIYIKNYNRILTNITSGTEEPGFYLYPNDKFFKDMAVCAGRMIPAGAQKVVAITCPKKFVFKKGLAQFLKGLHFILCKLRSFNPVLYEMHTDTHDQNLLDEHNYEGWIRFYINIANLLRIKKGIKGIYGISWLVDPQIEEVSPRHSYIRRLVTENGGKLFYIGPNEQSIQDAITKSPTRRRLYSEGKYMPTEYMIIWSRQSLIDWADRLPSDKE